MRPFSEILEMVNFVRKAAAGRYAQSLQAAISQGHGFDQARQMAVS